MSANRSRVYLPTTRFRLTRWLPFYLAMLLADAAVIVMVVAS